MSLLNRIKYFDYIMILILIRRRQQEKENMISGMDLYKLCQEQYNIMQRALTPLREKLGDNVEIIDINCIEGMQEETRYGIKYLRDGKEYSIMISRFGEAMETKIDRPEIIVFSTDSLIDGEEFLKNNKGLIIETLKRISEHKLYEEIVINSVTKKFIFKYKGCKFNVYDKNGLFNLGIKYQDEEDNSEFIPVVGCAYPRLRELLNNNAIALCEKIYVNKDDVSRTLKKII